MRISSLVISTIGDIKINRFIFGNGDPNIYPAVGRNILPNPRI